MPLIGWKMEFFKTVESNETSTLYRLCLSRNREKLKRKKKANRRRCNRWLVDGSVDDWTAQVIRNGCEELAHLTDRIIQEFSDPLVLQPASLDVATVKKKPDDDHMAPLNAASNVSGTADGIDLWIQVPCCLFTQFFIYLSLISS